MAGFFNFEKPGPGVRKDEPKPKGLKKFFGPYFTYFWRISLCGIWYWLISIPVLTAGLASAGMTNVTHNISVGGYSFGSSDFFETIKKNWKQSLLVGIINTIITALLIFDIGYFYVLSKASNSMLFCLVGIAVLFAVFSMVKFYVWNIVITFKLKTKDIYFNAFRFVFLGIKNNLLTVLSLVCYYALFVAAYFLPIPGLQWAIYFILLLIFPGFKYYAISFNAFPIIKQYMIDPYYKEHPDEDIGLRTSLHIMD